jgi:HK97 family phage portal protein
MIGLQTATQRAPWWSKLPVVGRVVRALRGRSSVPARFVAPDSVKHMSPQTMLPPGWTGRAVFKDWSLQVTIDKALEESTYVYACASLNTDAVASVPWHVVRISSDGRQEPDTEHELNRFIKAPNSDESFTDLLKRIELDLQLSGNALLDINRDSTGAPVFLWRLKPGATTPVPAGPGSLRTVKYYEFRRDDGSRENIATEDVIHLQALPDPECYYWGFSRLRSGGKAIDIDVEAAEYQKSMLQNRAVLAGLITLSGPNGEPVPIEKAQAYKEAWTAAYEGSAAAGKTAFVGADLKYQRLGGTAEEIGFTAGREAIRDEIAALFRVPPPLVSILDDATYSNTREVRRIWWEQTIIPDLSSIRDGLNRQFVDREWPDDNVALEYDVTGVAALTETFTERLEQAKMLKELGWTDEEIEVRLNLGRR